MSSACGGIYTLIDDTYGFDGIRTHVDYAPTLRSNRSGLKIAIGCAMRGRYTSDNKTEQKIELNNEEISNSITTVQKDSMVIEVKK